MTWTQPCCDDCWARRNGARTPTRLKEEYRSTEVCAFCGRMTRSGTYVREDPATVRYPAKEKA